MKNKLIAIILTINILSVQVFAGFFSDSLSSTTPAMSGNVNGQNVYYTGGFSYKIGSGKGIPLLWNIQGPELKVGCGGISFKGMFGSLIDTDALETMLKDAGAALAWGILMGLVYSLPGVADVLAKIQQFARELQKLLANACQMGQSIGKGLANRASNYMEGSETKWLGDMKKKVDAAKQGVESALDSGMDWMKGLPGDLDDWANEKLPPNEQAGIVGSAIRDMLMFKNYAYVVFRGIRNSLKKAGEIDYPSADADQAYQAEDAIPLDLYSMEDFSSSLSDEERTNLMLKSLLLNFKINLMGTLSLNEPVVAKIMEMFNASMKGTAPTDEAEKKAKEEFMEKVTKNEFDILKYVEGDINSGIILQLLLGTDNTTESKINGLKTKIAVPKLVPVTLSLGKTSTEIANVDILKVDTVDDDAMLVEHFYDTFNLKKLNTCLFYNAFESTNNTTLINLLVTKAQEIDSSTLTVDNIASHCSSVSQDFGPVLNVFRYINIILQSPQAAREGLFSSVYTYNLYRMNEAFYSLLSSMASVDKEAETVNVDTIQNEKALAMKNAVNDQAKDSIEAEQAAVKKFLEDYSQKMAERFVAEKKNTQQIEKMFDDQDKANRTQGIKSYSNTQSGK